MTEHVENLRDMGKSEEICGKYKEIRGKYGKYEENKKEYVENMKEYEICGKYEGIPLY